MPKNPTSSGPLTDLPDYSFMDGRPTPLGVNEKTPIIHWNAFNDTLKSISNYWIESVWLVFRRDKSIDWINNVISPRGLCKILKKLILPNKNTSENCMQPKKRDKVFWRANSDQKEDFSPKKNEHRLFSVNSSIVASVKWINVYSKIPHKSFHSVSISVT